MADLLEALGENPHRIRAYRTASAVLGADVGRFGRCLKDGTLDRLPGLGADLAAKVQAVANGDDCPGKADLVARIPSHTEQLTAVPGIDRKLAIYLTVRLHVDSVSQLRQLADTHMLRTIPWLSADREASIRDALAG
jgi:DNA polymerase (family 10)